VETVPDSGMKSAVFQNSQTGYDHTVRVAVLLRGTGWIWYRDTLISMVPVLWCLESERVRNHVQLCGKIKKFHRVVASSTLTVAP